MGAPFNLHVGDARATAAHLDSMGVSWLAALEYREPDGAWFATMHDPDGFGQGFTATPARASLSTG